jgi:hypothetical protein
MSKAGRKIPGINNELVGPVEQGKTDAQVFKQTGVS